MTTLPRIVVAAPASGHGKTAVAVGLLAAARARGVRPVGFKIGPDFVDAGYLGYAAGTPGRNLDPQLVGAARLGPLLLHGSRGRDLAVVEGTMGLYDGLAGRVDTESTAQIAGLLRAPVVLVVDVATMGQSVAALVHGFRGYDEMLWLGGVILNRVGSDRHEQVLRESLADLGVPVLGALRRGQLTTLPVRSAGVVPVLHGTVEAARAVRRLGEAVAANVDVDRIIALARSAPALVAEAWSADPGVPAPPGPVVGAPEASPPAAHRPLVAIAGTGHGDYGYLETRELLISAGADVVTVDPLRDNGLPAGVSGLVLGGAVPEGYLDEIAANVGFLRSVATLAASGAPITAEAGGLALLSREHAGRPMAGVLPTSTRQGDHLVLGYREATARSASVLLPAGARVWGYKQHTGLAAPRAGASAAWLWPGGALEGFVHLGVHASYLTVHWAGIPGVAGRFVAAARQVRFADPRPIDLRPTDSRPVESRPAEPRAVEPHLVGPTAVEQLAESRLADWLRPETGPAEVRPGQVSPGQVSPGQVSSAWVNRQPTPAATSPASVWTAEESQPRPESAQPRPESIEQRPGPVEQRPGPVEPRPESVEPTDPDQAAA